MCKDVSPPSRAAWIEMCIHSPKSNIGVASPPSRAAWIEISSLRTLGIRAASPPSRAAWIEIRHPFGAVCSDTVAAFTGGVD